MFASSRFRPRLLLSCGAFLILGVILVGTQFITRPASAADPMPTPTLNSGSDSQCVQIPPQTDLSTLSDAQLFAYGLPGHAEVMSQLDRWTSWLATGPQRECDLPMVGTRPASALPNEQPDVSGVTSSNWAGNVATGARGTYREAEVTFYVPTITGSDGDIASGWTGVGGGGSTSPQVLVQAGVDVTKTLTGTHKESWVEVYPNVATYDLPLCRVNTGDKIDVYVSSNFGNDGYDYFNITNFTAHCDNSCYVHTDNTSIRDTCGFTGGHSFNTDAATGECIAERVGGARVAQWNAPSHTWRQYSCLMSGKPIMALTHHYDTLVNSHNSRLVYPGSLDAAGDFDFVWVAAS
jgi:hypothetical protein